MSITVACENLNCGRSFKVSDESVGARVTCPHCEHLQPVPPLRKAKGKLFRLGLCAVLVLGTVACIYFLVWLGYIPTFWTKLRYANYNRVQRGMTVEEVEDILGRPSEWTTINLTPAEVLGDEEWDRLRANPGPDFITNIAARVKGRAKTAVWSGYGRTAHVTFIDGKAAQKTFSQPSDWRSRQGISAFHRLNK